MIILIIIDIDKQGQNGTTIFNILDNTTELYMIKYTIGEIFSSGGATLYKNPSDQTVILVYLLADCRPIPIFENLNRIFLPNLIDLILQWLRQRHTNHFHRKNMHSFSCMKKKKKILTPMLTLVF